MEIQIELFIAIILIFIFMVWLIWNNLSLFWHRWKYKKKLINDGRKERQGGEKRGAETSGGESVVSDEEFIPAGTSQPAERELLPSADADVSGKNSSRFRNSLDRIRRRK